MLRISHLALGGLALGPIASADVWDVPALNDNSSATRAELVHGTDQLHDLGVLAGPTADQDWFVLRQQPRASYEVIVDSTSPDLGPGGPLVVRLDSDGTTVLQVSLPVGAGNSRSLAWENATGAATVGYVRIRGDLCTTDCGPEDVYRIRFRETTGRVARFNNSATQVSLLVLKNAGGQPLAGHIDFWSGGGTLLATAPLAIAANGTFTLNTMTVAPGASGSVSVSHDGPHGALVGKMVSVEPATGFTFDTPLVLREPQSASSADGTKSYCNSPFGCFGGGSPPNANVTCASGQCGFSCMGEAYDSDGQEASGCEVIDNPQGNHSQATAVFLGSFDCDDGSSAISIDGLLPSDARVHENPAVPSFDPATGSAPDWHRIHALGGFACVKDVFMTLQVVSSFPTCYRMTVITDLQTLSCSTSSAGSCTIDPGTGSYSDDTDIFIAIDKTCALPVQELVSYNFSGHF